MRARLPGAGAGRPRRAAPPASARASRSRGYDDLTAAQIQTRLGTLTPAELRKVRDYERRNANRKTVLKAIESKLELAPPSAASLICA